MFLLSIGIKGRGQFLLGNKIKRHQGRISLKEGVHLWGLEPKANPKEKKVYPFTVVFKRKCSSNLTPQFE